MKRSTMLLMAAGLLLGCARQQDPLAVLRQGKWVDLTWSFDENSVYWPTNIPFTHDTVFAGINDKGWYYSSFVFRAEEHGGTHFDAPLHFAQGGRSVDQVPVDRLTAEGVMVDVTARTASNRDYAIGIDDLKEWETSHGRIPDHAIVLFNTGYAQYYPDRQRYTGTELTGKEGVENLHFPALHPDAAAWLADERSITAVGLDVPSIDIGQSRDFLVHRTLFAKNVTAYENVAHLDQLPPRGFWVVALPMKIAGGSGAPLRIVAFVP